MKMLRFLGCVWLFVALFFGAVLVATVAAVQGPSSAAMAGTTGRAAAASCPSSEQPQPNHKPLFGMPQRIPKAASATAATSALLQDLRGGHVHEPETAADVDALVLKAASEQKLVVIDFSATWCGPCKMIAPLFKELSEGMEDVVFVKVDVDDNPDTAAKYNVSAMPTFIFLKSGEVVDRLMGANPTRLQELIDELK